jgi:pyruvate/2-oxoglutarate/acetoin dehydrogenase E1 component
MVDCLDGPILRVGAPYTPVPVSPERFYLPKAEDVIQAVRKVLEY